MIDCCKWERNRCQLMFQQGWGVYCSCNATCTQKITFDSFCTYYVHISYVICTRVDVVFDAPEPGASNQVSGKITQAESVRKIQPIIDQRNVNLPTSWQNCWKTRSTSSSFWPKNWWYKQRLCQITKSWLLQVDVRILKVFFSKPTGRPFLLSWRSRYEIDSTRSNCSSE